MFLYDFFATNSATKSSKIALNTSYSLLGLPTWHAGGQRLESLAPSRFYLVMPISLVNNTQ